MNEDSEAVITPGSYGQGLLPGKFLDGLSSPAHPRLAEYTQARKCIGQAQTKCNTGAEPSRNPRRCEADNCSHNRLSPDRIGKPSHESVKEGISCLRLW